MTITGAQVLAQARTHDGRFRYDQGPSRTTGADGYIDCSGHVVLTLNQLGIYGVPTVSSTLARWCQANHTDGIPMDVALRTPGVLLFHGPNHGYDGFGNDGHVAFSLGDGVGADEAVGHSYPASMGDDWPNRGWSNAGYIPGVDYQNHPPRPVVVPKLARILHFNKPPAAPMHGDDVLDVQTKLFGWAFITRNAQINPGAHDGRYGKTTARAVMAFQRSAGEIVDSIVGARTWASLYRI